MTEGNIASWKVKEGDEFVAGDVLLEVETDKAQMDVEAQDDGVMAKIMVCPAFVVQTSWVGRGEEKREKLDEG